MGSAGESKFGSWLHVWFQDIGREIKKQPWQIVDVLVWFKLRRANVIRVSVSVTDNEKYFLRQNTSKGKTWSMK